MKYSSNDHPIDLRPGTLLVPIPSMKLYRDYDFILITCITDGIVNYIFSFRKSIFSGCTSREAPAFFKSDWSVIAQKI